MHFTALFRYQFRAARTSTFEIHYPSCPTVKTIRQTKLYIRWYNRLRDNLVKTRIAVRIRRMQLGNSGDAESVGGGVFELRFDFVPGYRVYYTERGG